MGGAEMGFCKLVNRAEVQFEQLHGCTEQDRKHQKEINLIGKSVSTLWDMKTRTHSLSHTHNCRKFNFCHLHFTCGYWYWQRQNVLKYSNFTLRNLLYRTICQGSTHHTHKDFYSCDSLCCEYKKAAGVRKTDFALTYFTTQVALWPLCSYRSDIYIICFLID